MGSSQATDHTHLDGEADEAEVDFAVAGDPDTRRDHDDDTEEAKGDGLCSEGKGGEENGDGREGFEDVDEGD